MQEETKVSNMEQGWRQEFQESLKLLKGDHVQHFRRAIDKLEKPETDLAGARNATKDLYYELVTSITASVNERSASKLLIRVIDSTFGDAQKTFISSELGLNNVTMKHDQSQLLRLQTEVKGLNAQILLLQRDLQQQFGHQTQTNEENKVESDFGSPEGDGEQQQQHSPTKENVVKSQKSGASSRKRDAKRNQKEAARDSTIRKNIARWSPEEHLRFIKAVELHGKDFKKITDFVQTRDLTEIRTYTYNMAKKFRADPSLDGAHLMEILEKPLQRGRKKTEVANANPDTVDMADEQKKNARDENSSATDQDDKMEHNPLPPPKKQQEDSGVSMSSGDEEEKMSSDEQKCDSAGPAQGKALANDNSISTD